MPYKDRDQDRDEDDDNDAYRSRSAPTAIVDYNRAISHTSHCSFRSSARVIPRVQASVPGSGEASAMWVWSGIVLAMVLAAVALWRSRATTRSYYEADVYGETAQTHRRWAFAFVLIALALGASSAWPPAEVPLLAVLALAGVLYGATFLRGASGEDE